MYELEIWGGATASYLRRFPQRRFRYERTVRAYVQRIRQHLEALGVTAAHPMWVTDHHGKVCADLLED